MDEGSKGSLGEDNASFLRERSFTAFRVGKDIAMQ